MFNWKWIGSSGVWHEFEVYSLWETNWRDVPGIYLMVKDGTLGGQRHFQPLYFGQAASLRDRLAGHDRWNEALRRGMTHVHAAVVFGDANRDRVEKDLIARWNPPMNVHHVSPLASLGALAPGYGAGIAGFDMFGNFIPATTILNSSGRGRA